MMRAKPIHLRVNGVEMRQVTHADRPSANLVFISRADTPPSRTNLARTGCGFPQAVEIAVDRKDQRTIVGKRKILRGDRHTLPAQLRHFIAQRPRIQHYAIADDRQCTGDDARRQQRQLVNIVAYDERMPGIMPTLKADNSISTFG